MLQARGLFAGFSVVSFNERNSLEALYHMPGDENKRVADAGSEAA